MWHREGSLGGGHFGFYVGKILFLHYSECLKKRQSNQTDITLIPYPYWPPGINRVKKLFNRFFFRRNWFNIINKEYKFRDKNIYSGEIFSKTLQLFHYISFVLEKHTIRWIVMTVSWHHKSHLAYNSCLI